MIRRQLVEVNNTPEFEFRFVVLFPPLPTEILPLAPSPTVPPRCVFVAGIQVSIDGLFGLAGVDRLPGLLKPFPIHSRISHLLGGVVLMSPVGTLGCTTRGRGGYKWLALHRRRKCNLTLPSFSVGAFF